MKRTLLSLVPLLLALAAPSFGQQAMQDLHMVAPYQLCFGGYSGDAACFKKSAANTVDLTGTLTVNGTAVGSGSGLNITTVSGLASVSGKTKGTIAVVTDGNSATDCTVGTSTTVVTCQYSGTTWAAFGGSVNLAAPGAIGGTTPAAGTFTTVTATTSVTTSGAGTIDATKLSGNLPAISGASLTSLPAQLLSGLGNPGADKAFDMGAYTLNTNFTGNYGANWAFAISSSSGANSAAGYLFEVNAGGSSNKVASFTAGSDGVTIDHTGLLSATGGGAIAATTAANLSGTPTLPSGTTVLTPSTTYTASCTLDLAAGSGKCVGPVVRMNVTSTANTVTVPPHPSAAFPLGTCITVRQVGTGVTTIVGDGVSGVTVTTPSSYVLRTRYSSVQLCQSDTQDVWDLYGDTQ